MRVSVNLYNLIVISSSDSSSIKLVKRYDSWCSSCHTVSLQNDECTNVAQTQGLFINGDETKHSYRMDVGEIWSSFEKVKYLFLLFIFLCLQILVQIRLN